MINTNKLKKVVTWKVDGKTYGSFIEASKQGTNQIWYNTSNGREANVDFEKFTPAASFSYKHSSGAFVIEFPGDVTEIKANAFENCTNLTGVSLPDKLEKIGTGAFLGAGIESLTIGANVTVLEEGVLAGANSLTSVTIDSANPVYSIDSSCVIDSSNGVLVSALADATGVPSGIERIGARAFYMNGSFNTLTLPGNITSVGAEAFKDSSLTALTVTGNDPDAVTLDEGALDGSYNVCVLPWLVDTYKEAWSEYAERIVAIEVANNQILYQTTDGNVLTPGSGNWNTSGTSAVITSNVYADGVGVITFDKDITKVPDGGFSDKTTLSGLVIPNSVVSVGEIKRCTSLTNIQLPENETGIEVGNTNGLFYGCTSLTNVRIPRLNNTGVNGMFNGCSSLKSVDIEDSNLTVMGNYMFNNCSSLEEIVIPEGVTGILTQCFNGCSSLKYVSVPTTLTTIYANKTFYGCSALERIDMQPINVPTLTQAYDMFGNTNETFRVYVPCESLEAYYTNVYLKNHVGCEDPTTRGHIYYTTSDNNPVNITTTGYGQVYIGQTYDAENERFDVEVFYRPTSIPYAWMKDMTTVTSVVIPEGVTQINDGAFANCHDGLTVTVPSTVTRIEGSNYGAFYTSNMIVTLEGTTPPTLSDYAKHAIYYHALIIVPCEALDTYKAANNWSQYASQMACRMIEADIYYTTADHNVVELSGNRVLSNTYDTENDRGHIVFMYPNVASAGPGNFTTNKANLLSVELPEGITEISYNFATGCSNLTSVNIPSSVTSLRDGCFQNCSALTSIDIPNSVTYLGTSCFQSCSSLTSIDIPNSVTYLGSSCFQSCSSLTSVNIPNSITIWYSSCFEGCTSLTSVNIQSGVTSLGGYCFKGCTSLTSIDIPSSVTSLGTNCFRKCSALTSVTVRNTTPPTFAFGGDVFRDTPAPLKIYVPSESVDTYKAASGWSGVASKIYPIPEA